MKRTAHLEHHLVKPTSGPEPRLSATKSRDQTDTYGETRETRMERPERHVWRDQRDQSMEHYSFKMKGKFTDVETEALDKCTEKRRRINHFFQHTGTLK